MYEITGQIHLDQNGQFLVTLSFGNKFVIFIIVYFEIFILSYPI